MSKKIVGKKTIKEKSSLRFEGIYENGYGLISKSFMKDKRLTIEAKSIYTYLCSYCGGGRTAYPSVALQCSDLCISENRYYKHRRLLEEYGYIKIEQQKEIVEYDDGTTKELFTNNIYTIVLNIDEEFKKKEAPPKKRVKSRIIKKVDSKKSNSSQTVDMTTSSPYLQFEGTKAVGMEDVSNNNNNINNNNFNNNNINIGRNRLFSILRDNGYLIKCGKDKNMPKQVYVKQGLFQVSEQIVRTVEGELLTATTLITGKGQMYFLDLLSNLT